MKNTVTINATRKRYRRKAKPTQTLKPTRTSYRLKHKSPANIGQPRTIGIIESFKPGDDWATFEERLQLYFKANLITTSRRMPVLLTAITTDVYEILKNLCSPHLPKSKSYSQLVNLLSNQFGPKESTFRYRIQFDSLKQGAESVCEWYGKVELLAAKCKFGAMRRARVTDKFVAGMRAGPILDRLCEEDVSKELRDLLEVALEKKEDFNEVGADTDDSKENKITYATPQTIKKSANENKLCYCYTIDVETTNKQEYKFYPNNNGYIKFKVQASSNTQISLTATAAECNPMYEVIIGGWDNIRSAIRKNRTKPYKTEALTPNILNANEFRTFWICWDAKTISVGRDNNPRPFLCWTDTEHVPIHYVGICTGWGANGSWVIHQGGDPREEFNDGDGIKWVSASDGDIPPNACAGGIDVRSDLYVIRCAHAGSLIPGKLHAGYRTAYIPLNGKEIEHKIYEVLCNCNGSWVLCSGGKIPTNAIVGGHSKDGEPLYIGRARHAGTVAIGKVQRSLRCCLIPYGGREYRYQQYEILVS